VKVDQIVPDVALKLLGISGQDFQSSDLRLLLITPLDHKGDHVIIFDINDVSGIGILVLEDDPLYGFNYKRCTVE
jgi:hypothetical protein